MAQSAPDVTSDNENVQLIQRFYEAQANGDFEGIREVLADDATWLIPGHHPMAGVKRGEDEIVAFFEQLGRAGFQADVIAILGGEDWAIDLHRGYASQDGVSTDQRWALAYRIANGEIQEVINLSSDQQEADRYFWSFFELKPVPERLVNDGAGTSGQ